MKYTIYNTGFTFLGARQRSGAQGSVRPRQEEHEKGRRLGIFRNARAAGAAGAFSVRAYGTAARDAQAHGTPCRRH